MMEIDQFLAGRLENAGYAGVHLQKTPLGTRIIVRAARPGLVIGKKGKTVKELTWDLEDRFNLENPNIEVEEVADPELNAQIMAERLASGLDRGKHYRRAAYSILRRIMRRGARGVEITISGKVTSQRARTQKFKDGVISKCGTPKDEGVSYGVAHTTQKSGTLGVVVQIMPLSYRLPDHVTIYDEPLGGPVAPKKEAEEESLFKPQEESGKTVEISTEPGGSKEEPPAGKANPENETTGE